MSSNSLTSHNEKRKAQDSSNNDLKDSGGGSNNDLKDLRDSKELKSAQGTYEDFRDV
jgi:hypothetical protein